MDVTTFNIAFAAMSSRRPMSQTFTGNFTVTFPAGTVQADMTGYGARGRAGSSGTVRQYKRDVTYYGVRRSDGVSEVVLQEYGKEVSGPIPTTTAYCDPPSSTGPASPYSSTQTCYSNFVDTSYSFTDPPVQGAAATISLNGSVVRSFAGSTGNVAQTPTSFTNVPVTSGTPYNGVVPSGGSITINYYA